MTADRRADAWYRSFERTVRFAVSSWVDHHTSSPTHGATPTGPSRTLAGERPSARTCTGSARCAATGAEACGWLSSSSSGAAQCGVGCDRHQLRPEHPDIPTLSLKSVTPGPQVARQRRFRGKASFWQSLTCWSRRIVQEASRSSCPASVVCDVNSVEGRAHLGSNMPRGTHP
jgi:hypothetical protein